MSNKSISISEAVRLIPRGCMLAIDGMTLYRRPVAFVRALISHYLETGTPDHITLLAFTAGIESDMLVGAGMVGRVRSCYFGLEIFGLAPMFTYHANLGEVEVIEETEASPSACVHTWRVLVSCPDGVGWGLIFPACDLT